MSELAKWMRYYDYKRLLIQRWSTATRVQTTVLFCHRWLQFIEIYLSLSLFFVLPDIIENCVVLVMILITLAVEDEYLNKLVRFLFFETGACICPF